MKLNNVMSKLIAALIALTCVFGCSGKKVDNGPVTKKVFAETISTGLTERWKLTDSDKEKTQTKNDYKNYTNSELKILKELEGRKFKDAKVKELYDEYKSALEEQYKTVIKYWGTNDYDDEWTKTYNERAKVLLSMNNERDEYERWVLEHPVDGVTVLESQAEDRLNTHNAYVAEYQRQLPQQCFIF